MNTYVIGTTIQLKASFTDESGTPIIPSAVAIKIKAPDGTVTSGTPTNVSSGVYAFNYVTAIAGPHNYRFESSGTYTVAQEGTFQVKKSGVV